MRTTKAQWSARGGLRNSTLYRRHDGRRWNYYCTTTGGHS